MGFLFGLMIGSMVGGGGSTALPPILGAIPIRCIAALEISDAEYSDCRSVSLSQELSIRCDRIERSERTGVCSLQRHLGWEITSIKELNKAAQRAAAVRP